MFFNWKRWNKKEEDNLEEKELTKEEVDDSFIQLRKETTSVIKEAMNVVSMLGQDLEQTKTRLNVIQSEVNNAIVLETANGKWINANQTACDIFGIENSECVGKSNTEIAEKYPHLAELIKVLIHLELQAVKTKTIVKDYVSLKKENLDTIHLNLNVVPVRNSKNEFTEFVIIGNDITQSYNKYHDSVLANDIFDAMPSIVIGIHPNFTIKYRNKMSLDVLGKNNSRKLSDIIDKVDMDVIKDTLCLEHIAFKTLNFTIDSYPILNKDGSPLYFLLHLTPN